MILSNTLTKAKNTKRSKRVGRGNGSNRGTYSGNGNKGQHSRGSGKIHPTFTGEGGRSKSLFGIPKLRGFRKLGLAAETITLNLINKIYEDGEVVSKESLFNKGLIQAKSQRFKIVATGDLTKKVTFEDGLRFSAKAKSSLKN
ncbi:MAG: 50S ribosomal protein L15 [Patescibacteria group bacterium]